MIQVRRSPRLARSAYGLFMSLITIEIYNFVFFLRVLLCILGHKLGSKDDSRARLSGMEHNGVQLAPEEAVASSGCVQGLVDDQSLALFHVLSPSLSLSDCLRPCFTTPLLLFPLQPKHGVVACLPIIARPARSLTRPLELCALPHSLLRSAQAPA